MASLNCQVTVEAESRRLPVHILAHTALSGLVAHTADDRAAGVRQAAHLPAVGGHLAAVDQHRAPPSAVDLRHHDEITALAPHGTPHIPESAGSE